MAVRLKWPATMSATLQTAIEDTLKHWRNLDKARPGGPHLPPYGLQHRVRVLYPDIQCLQDGEELADPDDRVLSHMHNPLDPLVEDEEVVKNACRSSMEDNHFSSYYRATEFTTAEEFYDAWNQADPEAALDALIHAPGSSLLCFLPYRKIGGDGIIRIRLTTQVAVETTDSPVLHNHTNTLLDYPLLDVFNWLRDPSRATKWAWVGDLMELVWGQSQRAIRHRILLLESRKFQFIDRNSPEAWVREKQNFDNAVQARYRFRMRRWPPYATIWEYRKTHYSDIPNELERFCAICWRPFGPYEQPILQEPYAYPCNRNHYICEECLVLTCRVTGPGSDVAKCLMDDTPCYTREEQDYLKYGEFQGVFAPPVPSHFLAWENYERSWADLDRRGRGTTATADAGAAGGATEDGSAGGAGGTVAVVPNGEIMITDPHMVVYIFMDIIQQDDRYPELCYQFRPILYPEMAHIVEAFCDAVSFQLHLLKRKRREKHTERLTSKLDIPFQRPEMLRRRRRIHVPKPHRIQPDGTTHLSTSSNCSRWRHKSPRRSSRNSLRSRFPHQPPRQRPHPESHPRNLQTAASLSRQPLPMDRKMPLSHSRILSLAPLSFTRR